MTTTDERKKLVAKYKAAQAKIKALEAKKYDYKINRSCEPFGRISGMDVETVVKAYASVHDNEKAINDAIAALELTSNDINGSEHRKLFGFEVSVWDQDFKLRIEQIRDNKELEKYKKASELLSKNFTEDDIFLMDMSEVDDLGVELD